MWALISRYGTVLGTVPLNWVGYFEPKRVFVTRFVDINYGPNRQPRWLIHATHGPTLPLAGHRHVPPAQEGETVTLGVTPTLVTSWRQARYTATSG